MEQTLKYIPFTTIIVIFFFVCGGLYLLGYWGTFDVDISSLVTLSEIPKSFIMPCAVAHALFFSSFFVAPYLFNREHKSEPQLSQLEYVKRRKINMKKLHIGLFIYPIAFFICWCFFNEYPLFWVISAMALCYLLFFWCVYINTIQKLLPNKFANFYVTFIFIFTPILCFSIAKAKAVTVYNNKDIKYIAIIKNHIAIDTLANKDSMSLKFLGFLGDKVIASSLDNKRIVYLNQSSFEGVELKINGRGMYWPFF